MMRVNFYQLLVGFLFLCSWGLIITYHLPNQQDVWFGDEITYLYSGITYTFPPNHGSAQWGGLYAAWYAFLNLFQPDTLKLYYLSYRVLIILIGSLTFIYLYLRRSGFGISLFCALCIQFFALESFLDRKITFMAACMLLIGLCIIYIKQWSAQTVMLITAVTALLCSYVRPEFYITFVLATVLTIGLCAYRQTRANYGWVQLIGLISLIVAMQWTMGNPMTDGTRSFDAYRQSFGINYSIWHHKPFPKTIDEEFRLFSRIYGKDVHTVLGAIAAQPNLAARQFLANAYSTLGAEGRMVGDLFYWMPFNGVDLPVRWLVFAVLLLLTALLVVDIPASLQQIKRYSRRFTIREFALLIMLLPSLITVIILYPSQHYIFFHSLGLITIVAFLLRHTQLRQGRAQFFKLSTVGMLLIWLAFQAIRKDSFLPTPTADTIRFIQSLPLVKPLVTLERTWYRVFMYKPEEAAPYWVRVEGYPANTDFTNFVKKQQVNFILVTSDLQRYFAGDTGFTAFTTQYSSEGFVRLATPESGSYLLLKKDMLSDMATIANK